MQALSVDDASNLGLQDTGLGLRSLRRLARRIPRGVPGLPASIPLAQLARVAAPLARRFAPMALEAVPGASTALRAMRMANPYLQQFGGMVPIPGFSDAIAANQEAVDYMDRTGAATPGLTIPDPIAMANLPRLRLKHKLGGLKRSSAALPMGPLVVARTLIQDPRSRRLLVRDLARACGVHMHDARRGVGALIEACRRGDVEDLRQAPSTEGLVGADDTFEEMMARFGGGAPPGGLGRRDAGALGAARFRVLSLSDASRLLDLAKIPAIARMRLLASITMHGVKDAKGLTPDGRSYITEPGDLGSTIAQKLVGNAGRWKELVTANPKTANAQYGMVFKTGDILVLPDSWVKSSAAPPVIPGLPPALPPLPVPGVPGLTTPGFEGKKRQIPVGAYWAANGALRYKMQGGDVTATIMATKFGFPSEGGRLVSANPGAPWGKLPVGYDLGTPADWAASFFKPGENSSPPNNQLPPVAPPISLPPLTPPAVNTAGNVQAQVMLVAWCKKVGAGDFGNQPSDVSGIWDARTKSACAAFQKWNNTNKGSSLPTGGDLDQGTYDALMAWVSSTIAQTAPPPVVPVPGGPGSFPGSPPAPPVPSVPGGISDVQKYIEARMILAGFARQEKVTTGNFGSVPADLANTGPDARFAFALGQFQVFMNANNAGKQALRTDGLLDNQTTEALRFWFKSVGGLPPIPGLPVPGFPPGTVPSVPPVGVTVGEKKSDVIVPVIGLIAAYLASS